MKFVYLLHIGIKSLKILKQKQVWFGIVEHYLFYIKAIKPISVRKLTEESKFT